LSEHAVPVDLRRHGGIVAVKWGATAATPELGVIVTVSSGHREQPYQIILS
jgi:hypothetical protein